MSNVEFYIIEDNRTNYTWKQVGLFVGTVCIAFAAMLWLVINIENLIW